MVSPVLKRDSQIICVVSAFLTFKEQIQVQDYFRFLQLGFCSSAGVGWSNSEGHLGGLSLCQASNAAFCVVT